MQSIINGHIHVLYYAYHMWKNDRPLTRWFDILLHGTDEHRQMLICVATRRIGPIYVGLSHGREGGGAQ